MANEPNVELLAEKLGQFLVALAGEDGQAVSKARSEVLEYNVRHGANGISIIIAAEFMWFALDERRRHGWPAEEYRAALTAIETVLETALADLSRRGAATREAVAG